jgi:hypothetical protein
MDQTRRVSTDTTNIATMQKWPTPSNANEVTPRVRCVLSKACDGFCTDQQTVNWATKEWQCVLVDRKKNKLFIDSTWSCDNSCPGNSRLYGSLYGLIGCFEYWTPKTLITLLGNIRTLFSVVSSLRPKNQKLSACGNKFVAILLMVDHWQSYL